ncbi:SDR family oxidoreductase [Streptomyces sp. NPDC004135]
MRTTGPSRSGGRVVVVTGATGGVGRATARAFAARGDKVALLARGREGLAAAADDVRRAGGEALVVGVDVSDARAVEDAARQVEDTLGPVDVWVDNAFTGVFAPFTEVTPEEFRRVTEVTYPGFVNGTRAALRHMLPRDRGTIVQVGSALAYRGIPLQAAYCGAKHAIQGFNESLRRELLHAGSGVGTTMVQLWVGGSTAATLIANAVAPGLLDRYLARTNVDAQQDRGAPDGPANLWEPADGPRGRDSGAHGRFDDEAKGGGGPSWSAAGRATGLDRTAADRAAGPVRR